MTTIFKHAGKVLGGFILVYAIMAVGVYVYNGAHDKPECQGCQVYDNKRILTVVKTF